MRASRFLDVRAGKRERMVFDKVRRTYPGWRYMSMKQRHAQWRWKKYWGAVLAHYQVVTPLPNPTPKPDPYLK